MFWGFGIIEVEVGRIVHIGFGTSAATAVIGLLGVLAWRIREGRTAVTVKKIIMPPLGMATGFCMFLAPGFRVPWTWALIAFLIGMVALAWPLLITSRLVRAGDAIMMQRSNAFFLVVIALAAIRYFARGYFDRIMSLDQTAGLFFVLAFGMILRWRLRMLSEYRALTAQPSMAA
jgi:membrane protein CcdC involved in cytochrome C biogenesis